MSRACMIAGGFLLTSVALLSGCIDLPETGPTPPDYEAQVRVVFADPALPTAQLAMADGATSTIFVDRLSGAYGSVSAYVSYPAGTKRIIIRKADGTFADADTAATTLGTETISTLILLPRRATAERRFERLGERYTFAAIGINDSSRVRFFNALASRDIVDVWALKGSQRTATLISDNLRYGVTSVFADVPRDSTWRFYLSLSTASAGISDTIRINGQSNIQQTVVLHDSLSRVKLLGITG